MLFQIVPPHLPTGSKLLLVCSCTIVNDRHPVVKVPQDTATLKLLNPANKKDFTMFTLRNID